MKIRIYYEDTDAGGIVYHANYLKYCERARSEMLFAKPEGVGVEGAHFVATHIDASFKSPARLGDIIEVKTKVHNIQKVRVTLLHSIVCDQRVLFEMTITLALTNAHGKPMRLTKEALALFDAKI